MLDFFYKNVFFSLKPIEQILYLKCFPFKLCRPFSWHIFLYLKITFTFSHLKLNVSDADVGPNAMLQYNILDDLARKMFKIDSTTGAIEILHSLDYERKTNYSFWVTVSFVHKRKYKTNLFVDILTGT